MKTKTVFLACITAFSLLAACTRTEPGNDPSTGLEPGTVYEGEGEVIGAEFTACVCCGGWLLRTANPVDTVLMGVIPQDADFLTSNNVSYPIPVKYKIRTDTTQCWDLTRYVYAVSLTKI